MARPLPGIKAESSLSSAGETLTGLRDEAHLKSTTHSKPTVNIPGNSLPKQRRGIQTLALPKDHSFINLPVGTESLYDESATNLNIAIAAEKIKVIGHEKNNKESLLLLFTPGTDMDRGFTASFIEPKAFMRGIRSDT
ncbi:hypothetical protein O181_022863 [Austropuccinia psidii MF-1]|uniref:Uncharacterized protein n=1 Tax=Austropuccinia psidii MF-1 TaxID=1389203 RepID=A0A9Q3CHR1_9BASI|nr:hypothetical protein [Austropuccinia psidii MF-1]